VHRVEAADGPLPRDLGLASTHAFGIADTIELARALGKAPRRVALVGVEGRAFGMGDSLSAEVEAALGAAVDAVLRTIEEA
jgi:hydrogenase maturation protease